MSLLGLLTLGLLGGMGGGDTDSLIKNTIYNLTPRSIDDIINNPTDKEISMMVESDGTYKPYNQ